MRKKKTKKPRDKLAASVRILQIVYFATSAIYSVLQILKFCGII